MARELSITQFRADVGDVINRVAYADERTVLTRRGKPVAMVVPYELGQLLERLFELCDLQEAIKVLEDPEQVGRSAEEIFGELGI